MDWTVGEGVRMWAERGRVGRGGEWVEDITLFVFAFVVVD